MSTLDKIKDITHSIGLPFFYGTAEELNEMVAGFTEPCCCLFRLERSEVSKHGAQMVERQTITINFIAPVSYEWSSTEQNTVVDACKLDALRWLVRAETYGNRLSVTGRSQMRCVYLDLSENYYSGVSMQVEITDYEGYAECIDY